jgi:hypothetical protein
VSEYGWVSLVALLGWMVLALSAYRAHRVRAGKTVVLALTWGAIFLLITAIFAAVGGQR